MSKFKTAFITFFPVIPDNMGSSTVINSRFDSWPNQKKLFQISHVNKVNNKYIKTIFIKKEKPINKIIKLPELIFHTFNYLKKNKKKIIIIEGASWIFYSFITLIVLKFLLPQSKIIYISHSIESEIRKKYSNSLIFQITKFLERLVFKYSFISTSVSEIEKNKIKKLYKVKTILYQNAINLSPKLKKKELSCDYIIYSGSYLYKPNKNAIDYLNTKIMPMVLKVFPKLKLVLTGGGFKKNLPWVINKNIVTKKILHNLIYYSKCMCVPLKFGSGTRIKIIEAISLGAIVISTHKGIEGIDLKNTSPPFIANKESNIIKLIIDVIKNNQKIKIKANKDKTYYLKKYSMKNITRSFIKKNIKI
tara:strand:- start:185 stop:1270 length:1086 start_codon:yes stop_codon:yes gene_type:complete